MPYEKDYNDIRSDAACALPVGFSSNAWWCFFFVHPFFRFFHLGNWFVVARYVRLIQLGHPFDKCFEFGYPFDKHFQFGYPLDLQLVFDAFVRYNGIRCFVARYHLDEHADPLDLDDYDEHADPFDFGYDR